MDIVETAVAAHDTTGGMSTKIAEAASIAATGIDVFVVEVISIINFSFCCVMSSNDNL